MFKKLFFLLIILMAPIFLSAGTWNVFCYMDSSDDLNDMAIKNITEMIHAQPNENVTFLLQVHAYRDVALRYQITRNGLQFLQESTLSGKSTQDFIDAAQWAFAGKKADHSMLICSNHGWGILDPFWSAEDKEWQLESYQDCESEATCSLPRCVKSSLQEHRLHKGFMFNDAAHTYLNNKDFVESLSFITEHILNGQKLDILGFDTCMGAMFEVGYQLAPFARYLVGSQSCSLRDGFNYFEIIKALNNSLEPKELATGMVHAFNDYYAKNDASGIYTHAALDLSLANEVRISFDRVLELLIDAHFIDLAAQACSESPTFCMWPMYTDFVTLCKIIESKLSKYSYAFPAIKKAMQEFYITAEKFVIARCGGFSTNDLAHGFAIYAPNGKIDASYYGTKFEQESLWIKILEYAQNNKIN
ncbi:hypothetical protein HYX58_01485 [Candidatus Dependentiae bacterium]|nr:hypothetical protein [Candidatus Dependentiae bacterium]